MILLCNFSHFPFFPYFNNKKKRKKKENKKKKKKKKKSSYICLFYLCSSTVTSSLACKPINTTEWHMDGLPFLLMCINRTYALFFF